MAASRAVLADVKRLGLDPTVPHSNIGATRTIKVVQPLVEVCEPKIEVCQVEEKKEEEQKSEEPVFENVDTDVTVDVTLENNKEEKKTKGRRGKQANDQVS